MTADTAVTLMLEHDIMTNPSCVKEDHDQAHHSRQARIT
jgi:hypothetical protein